MQKLIKILGLFASQSTVAKSFTWQTN